MWSAGVKCRGRIEPLAVRSELPGMNKWLPPNQDAERKTTCARSVGRAHNR